jgi:hypothetical protein
VAIRIWLLISFQLLALSIAQASTNFPSCGTYLIQGLLTAGTSGVDQLEVHPGSGERFVIALHGLSVDDLTAFDGKEVQLKLQIYHSTAGIIRAHTQGHPTPAHLDSTQKQSLILQKKEP